ncbi:hypothetical protein GCM10010211_71280 [Streptomyces albospinus]|uniref:Uncharacterized protein n=1 Tax=Streptomyces albospinus TaxID=285515 RepID=A0ABQ2VMA9_9ACTN|nr:hypothetical protein GCM10010211_71280 [Streptomyces albospinus]
MRRIARGVGLICGSPGPFWLAAAILGAEEPDCDRVAAPCPGGEEHPESMNALMASVAARTRLIRFPVTGSAPC